MADRGSGSTCTDTRWYWALTEHIYRYNHHNSGNATSLANGVHTVNECKCLLARKCYSPSSLKFAVLVVDGFLEQIRFFTTLVLNADEFEA